MMMAERTMGYYIGCLCLAYILLHFRHHMRASQFCSSQNTNSSTCVFLFWHSLSP